MTLQIETATMKVEEAARLLGIGRQTVYNLANQGKLPGARRLGRRIVISRKVLEEFLSAERDSEYRSEYRAGGQEA